MIRLDAATVLLQWATGGLAFLGVTTRHRQVGLGYGWLLRIVFGLMAAGALAVGVWVDPVPVRAAAAALVVLAAGVALVSSVRRRAAGVEGQREQVEVRSVRVAAMTGIERTGDGPDFEGREFDPRLDLLAPAFGLVGLVAGAVAAGGPSGIAIARTLVGAAVLGAVSDAMLLGHWYLGQPGLGRGPLKELVMWTAAIWPAEVALLLVPTGMVSVLNGSIEDGYGGMLGWFWVASAITTIALVAVTVAALREREYAAVMAATGLLYLAILTAFGTDLGARATVSG
mgnify:CR=1 FL=1